MIELLRLVDGWQLLAGLGLFLFGMAQAESALTEIAGPRLKSLLRRYTNRPARAIASGIGATALIQSSSAVGLMTLAFVGAGLITLANGLGVIIGANLGTTMTGWIVTTLGFKFDITRTALVLIALGSIVTLATPASGRWHRMGKFAIGFGLLFYGLDLMKDAFGDPSAAIEGAIASGRHPLVYLLVGIAITAIIQSSSAMMMITLSMLSAGYLTLTDAAALVIGADLGTTVTVLLGGLKGGAEKRQVALAHVLFNLLTDAIAFLALLPLLPAVVAWLGVTDELYAVVAFHSAFNIVGIALFFPFLKPFARLLQRLVPERGGRTPGLLSQAALAVPDAALEAMTAQTDALYADVLNYMRDTLQRPDAARAYSVYEGFKAIEGDAGDYAIELEKAPLTSQEGLRLRALQDAVRDLVHASKCFKDIVHNLEEIKVGPPAAQTIHERLRAQQDRFLALIDTGQPPTAESLEGAAALNRQQHEAMHRVLIASDLRVDQETRSSLLNVNREITLGHFDLVNALADRHLAQEEARKLAGLPVF